MVQKKQMISVSETGWFLIFQSFKTMYTINNQRLGDMLQVHKLEITKEEKDVGYLWPTSVIEP